MPREYSTIQIRLYLDDMRDEEILNWYRTLRHYTKAETIRSILYKNLNNGYNNGKRSLIDRIKGIFGLNNGNKGSNGHLNIEKLSNTIVNKLKEIVGESVNPIAPPSNFDNKNNRNQKNANSNSNTPVMNYGVNHGALMDELKQTIKDRKCD